MGSHFEPGGRSRGEGVPTLGAFVVRLRPGSACVCCGAELRAKNALTAASRSDYTLHGCRRGFVGALYFLA